MLKLSHRRMLWLLAISLVALAVFPWVSGEHGPLARMASIRLHAVLMAGIVLVRHRSLYVVHPLLLTAVAVAWLARFCFQGPDIDLARM
jgi:hypothetical protein